MEYIPYLISGGSLLLAILAFARNGKHDTTADATERATMTADIRYIRQGVDELKLDNRETRQDVAALQLRLTKVEEAVESAHQRLDDLMKGT